MNQLLAQLSKATKVLLLLGIALIAYDYICQAGKLYFFWESGVIGWFLLLLGAISLLLNRIGSNSTIKGSAVIEKMLVFGLVFVLLIKIILFGAFAFSDAFEVASNYLKTNSQIKREIGRVSGVILFSEGEINTSNNSKGEQGQGVLTLVAKGENKYKLFEVHLIKRYELASWQVVEAIPIE